MSEKTKLLAPNDLVEHIVNELTNKAKSEISTNKFFENWGLRIYVDFLSDAIVDQVVANLDAIDVVTTVELLNSGRRSLLLNRKRQTPELENAESFRKYVFDQLAKVAFNRTGTVPPIPVGPHYTDASLETVMHELAALGWQPELSTQERSLLIALPSVSSAS